jgi:hypothetical protein
VGKQCGQCGEVLRAGLNTERIATYFGQTVLADYFDSLEIRRPKKEGARTGGLRPTTARDRFLCSLYDNDESRACRIADKVMQEHRNDGDEGKKIAVSPCS